MKKKKTKWREALECKDTEATRGPLPNKTGLSATLVQVLHSRDMGHDTWRRKRWVSSQPSFKHIDCEPTNGEANWKEVVLQTVLKDGSNTRQALAAHTYMPDNKL